MERWELKQAVGRLLGPAEPEVGCDASFDHLDRYVERELAGEDAGRAIPGLRAHLGGSPSYGEEYDSLRARVGGERRRSALRPRRRQSRPRDAEPPRRRTHAHVQARWKRVARRAGGGGGGIRTHEACLHA
jgi:hypothetical protein